MAIWSLLPLAGFLLSTPLAWAGNVTLQNSGWRVLFPPAARGIFHDMAMADFGEPVYGASLIGKLVYPAEDPTLNPTGKTLRCPSANCEYGCDNFSVSTPPFSVPKVPGQHIIMLLERGPRETSKPCYFLLKAYNAQQAGADAVLIIDDSDTELTTAIAPTGEESVTHLLANLTVSLSLIARKDGAMLKELLKNQATVTLALNWTSIEPRRTKVSWELWTSTWDECGTLCTERANFISGMKSVSRGLSQANLTEFSPHYIIYSCPKEYRESAECLSECIMNGTYCVPDPSNLSLGVKGTDILAVNVRHLCYAKVAAAAGTPWLWWDYSEKFGQMCKSKDSKFTVDCAREVFVALDGPTLLSGQGQAKWDECIASGTYQPGSNATFLPLLEDELIVQEGGGEVSAISIEPTVRINGKQYRGTLETPGVTRAICAAFPLGQEPSICNDKSISEDECDPAGIGSKNCRVQDPDAAGRTRCINTFSGYSCECGQGWVRSIKADTGEEVCEDLNECLATNIRLTDPQCGCSRCACINLPGKYKCTGQLDDQCTAKYSYGGCWQTQQDGKTVHACQDTINEYKSQAARGTLNKTAKWHTCKCPTGQCFAKSGGSDDAPECSAQCSSSACQNGLCASVDPSGTAPTQGGGSAPAQGNTGGMGAGMAFLVVFLTVGVTTGALYAVYHYVLRQRMEGEIRDIMSQYMPLDQSGGRSRPGSGGGLGRSGSGSGGRPFSLSPVNERDELSEDSPLMSTGSGMMGTARTTSRPSPSARGQGSFLPPTSSGEQRTAFGGLISPGSQDKAAGAYQPPAPVPEDDPDVSGLMFGAPPSTAATHRTTNTRAPAAPIGDAPLLGDGPL